MKYLILAMFILLSGCAREQYSDAVCLAPGAVGTTPMEIMHWRIHCERFAPKPRRSYGRIDTTTRVNGKTYRSTTRVRVTH